jgi:hypothetical protein
LDKEIFDMLYSALQSKSSVRLYNLYKGVPITNEAEIIGLDNVFVYLRVTQYQLASIYLERGTYIQTSESSYSLRSQLSKLDLARGEVYLTNIVKVHGGIGNRRQIRVEPQDPIWVSLQLKNSLSSVTTRLADLSSTGLGVYMERFYFQPNIYRVGAELKVTFDIPMAGVTSSLTSDSISKPGNGGLTTRFGRDQLRGINSGDDFLESRRDKLTEQKDKPGHINSDALVVHFRPELYLNRYRIGLRLINDENGRQVLSHYISQRQANIIREFRTVYETMLPKK